MTLISIIDSCFLKLIESVVDED